ncbi:MAG: cyanophycinase, partial [Phycisphaerae bacterium]|nr:cyanophycinase [Phycisphaerae bacterium]
HDYSRDGIANRIRSHHQVQQVTIVHTHDRTVADSRAFVRPIARATGVWFSGGRQWRLTKAYLGTRAEKAFHDVLARGGVIGGSSAGATIAGSFLARGDTRGNTVMIGDVQQGFGFIQNVAIDQHIVPRRRELDMIRLLEDPMRRMKPQFDRASLLGLGIDEDTAIVVRGNRLEVIGKPDGQVFVYDPRTWTTTTPDLKKYTTLGHGTRYDLKRRQPLETPVVKPSADQAPK